jgi:hypothetical protein
MPKLFTRLTPTILVSVAVSVLAVLAAFQVTLSVAEQGAVVAFVGAGGVVLLLHRTAESIVALISAGLAVAVAFGLPVTSAQSESILVLAGLAVTVVFGKSAAQKLAARKRAAARRPSAASESTIVVKVDPHRLGELAKSVSGQVSDVLIRGVSRGRKTGRRKPKNAPALRLRSLLTGVVPTHPLSADHFGTLAFGLYGNDKFGVCGPTSVANLIRLITGCLLGAEITPSQEDVYDLYRRSGNPKFDPATDADDNGVDMQTMLEELLKNGIGDGKGGKVKPVAFAKVDVTNDAELEAAVSIFGGVLWGVNLETAQEAQTDATTPRWDHKRSAEWGRHAVLNGAYEASALEDVISWAIRVQTTGSFRANQLEEAWVVVFPWHLENRAFQAGVDVAALAVAYKALTGKDLEIPTPAPAPAPAPAEQATSIDQALWAIVRSWTLGRHSAVTKSIAAALKSWAADKGLS